MFDVLQTSQDFIVACLVSIDAEDAFSIEELHGKGFDLNFKEMDDSKFFAQTTSLDDDEDAAKNVERMLKHCFLMETPRLDFVGMAGGPVKSSMVYEKLVTWLTSDSEIVVDAYTGGGLGRASITKQRHVISLVDSFPHIGFLRSFYCEVRNHSRGVQKWCVGLSSMEPSSANMIPNLEILLSSIPQPKDSFSIDSDNDDVIPATIDMQEIPASNEEVFINQHRLLESVETRPTGEQCLHIEGQLQDVNEGI